MYEAIIDVNDREFNQSIGNWTGNTGWIPGPFFGKTGIGRIVIPAGSQWGFIQIGYPHFVPLQGKLLTITAETIWVSGGGGFFGIIVILTDGAYYFHRYNFLDVQDEWVESKENFFMPYDWNIENSLLQIYHYPSGHPGNTKEFNKILAQQDENGQEPGRPPSHHHLPIIWVG